jgi:hypothetical protein
MSSSNNKNYKKNNNKSNYKNNKRNNNNNNRNDRRNNNRRNNNLPTVKISELPPDMTLRELNEKMQPWGRIGNINLKKNWGTYIGYVDFYDLDDAEYFVEQLDGTGFENRILKVELIKNNVRNK